MPKRSLKDRVIAIAKAPKPIRLRRQKASKVPSSECSAPSTDFYDITKDLLEKIIRNINICDHSNIRLTSKSLRDVSDIIVMKEYRAAIARLPCDPISEDDVVLKVLNMATELFVASGFSSALCGCLLPMFSENRLCPQMNQLRGCLLTFYDIVDAQLRDLNSPQSLLLYSLTFIRMLKKFKKATIDSTNMINQYWSCSVELRTSWFGMLWSSMERSCTQPEKFSHLIVMLANVLASNLSENSQKFSSTCHFEKEIYVFGNDPKNKSTPKTAIEVLVRASKRTRLLYWSCMKETDDCLRWPINWSPRKCNIEVKVECREAEKWGCSKSQHMEFGPCKKMKKK